MAGVNVAVAPCVPVAILGKVVGHGGTETVSFIFIWEVPCADMFSNI